MLPIMVLGGPGLRCCGDRADAGGPVGRCPAAGGAPVTEVDQQQRGRFPAAADVSGEPATAAKLHPGHVLGRQLRLAQQRATWLGERLREQIEADGGTGGLVGDQLAATADGGVFRVSEYARVLGELEARERRDVARRAETAARLGIDARPRPGRINLVPVSIAVGWIGAVCEATGLDWSAPETRRLVGRALIEQRERELGHPS